MLERFGIGATQELQAYAGEMANDPLESWLEDMPAIAADERFDLGLDYLLDGIAARRPASR
ncbi:hypothetical protein [Spongiactinospora rosea]|nr:hypothetical protein [Spongiactinospora rosea]